MPNHRTTPENFIAKCKELHRDKYDYSKTQYTTSREFVTITCPIHGDFTQRASTHLSKMCGCQKCKLGVRRTTADFITDAKTVHGNKYDYSLVEYMRKQDPIKIICREHGVFLQRPSDHLRGSGCPSCAKYGFNLNLPAYFYMLESNQCIKIGVTNRDVNERVWQINNNCKNSGIVFEVVLAFKLKGSKAKQLESAFKLWAKERYYQPVEKFDGYTECFIGVDYMVVFAKIFELMEELNQ